MGYDECYPGGLVEMGGAWDSDEEADYSKMDAGPKKNQMVNRWDFDTEEEYATYMVRVFLEKIEKIKI